jgi:hypothetical protein
VRVLSELAGASVWKKANNVPAAIEQPIAQRRKTSKARRLKKAEREIEFFSINRSGDQIVSLSFWNGSANRSTNAKRVTTFFVLFGFFHELSF